MKREKTGGVQKGYKKHAEEVKPLHVRLPVSLLDALDSIEGNKTDKVIMALQDFIKTKKTIMTNEKIEVLEQNLQGTQWTNVRIEDDQLVADYNGDLTHAIGGGRYNCYQGITPCKIHPSAELIREVQNFGPDQIGWVDKNLDYSPL